MLTLSVCALLGHWGQLHLPFSQGQPAVMLGSQTLLKRLGERTTNVEDEYYPYLQSFWHVQFLACMILYVLGRLVWGRWCFIYDKYDAESHKYETFD
jgi:hypothetical protein